MRVTLLRPWIVAAILLAGAPAQQLLGGKLRAPTWQTWLQGEKAAIGGDEAPACTLFAFYTKPMHAPSFASHADYLVDLQRRFLDQGLVVVAVVADGKPAGLPAWAGCRVVVDDESATTAEWFGDVDSPSNLVLLDKKGTVVFFGKAESGLVDAIDAAVAGRRQLGREREATSLRESLPVAFDDIAGADAVAALDRAVAHAPRDGLALGLLYLAHAMKRNDAAAAAKVLQQAATALAAESRPLAAFADLALRGDPRRPDLAATLKPPLQAAAAAAPNDAAVQLAYLRTLVLAGDGREAGRQSMKIRKLVTATAADCLDFATILTSASDAAPHRDLATIAVDKAEQLGATGRLLTAARYGIALRCASDAVEQKRLLDEYLKDTEGTINNDCWYLMTDLPTMGRYDPFAAGLAERMLEQKAGMDYFEYDTAALAMFVVGRVGEAVELQQTAVDKGGRGNPEYEERLQRYKVALASAAK